MSYEYFSRKIGSAARILDLKGDFSRALEILDGLLKDEKIENENLSKFEIYAFIADIYSHLGDKSKMEKYIKAAREIELEDWEIDISSNSYELLDDLENG